MRPCLDDIERAGGVDPRNEPQVDVDAAKVPGSQGHITSYVHGSEGEGKTAEVFGQGGPALQCVCVCVCVCVREREREKGRVREKVRERKRERVTLRDGGRVGGNER